MDRLHIYNTRSLVAVEFASTPSSLAGIGGRAHVFRRLDLAETTALHGEAVQAAADRGPGIAAGEVQSLFKKFTRLSPQPTGSEPSSGLGPYIVQSLAARMRATAGFEPNPEGGSVFFLDLQAAACPAVTPSRSSIP
jgi:hypothetical protein